MFKYMAAGLTVFVMAADGASACIGFDDATDTFSSSCSSKHYVEYRTVGGGCYSDAHGKMTLQAGQKMADPKLSQSCGSVGKWWVQYTWCEFSQWKNGSCKPKF